MSSQNTIGSSQPSGSSGYSSQHFSQSSFPNSSQSSQGTLPILPTTQDSLLDQGFEDEEDDLGEVVLDTTVSGRKRLFSKELRCMMYGFGDDQNPYTESVDLLEDLVIEFITEITHRYVD